MGLPTLQGDIFDNVSHSVAGSMNEYHAAKTIKLPDSVPVSAGGLNKTSEIILSIFHVL